jgi:D-alanyl-D-alanine carboxypeptidase/D-alanyl-D-alanine carboxypeptidase (penicillin-binding protein 5/6)
VRDGHRLFGVVLGGRTAAARDQLMARLLDDGFAHRQTPPVLVAQAGGASRSAVRSMLAALSPIQSADAEPSPAAAPAAKAKHHRVHGKRAAATLAKAGCKPARKGAKAACAQRKVAATRPAKGRAKLARHTVKGKHKEIVASRRSEPRD